MSDVKKADSKSANQNAGKEIVYNPDPDPEMTIYTAFAILAALVSVALTAFATILAVDTGGHASNTKFGNYTLLDNPISMEWFAENLMDNPDARTYRVLVIVATVIIFIATFGALFVAIRSINPKKKPLVLVGVAIFALALAVVLLLIFGYHFANLALEDAKSAYIQMDPATDFSTTGVFDVIYYGTGIAALANLLFAGMNVFGILYGNNRFTRDGKAF